MVRCRRMHIYNFKAFFSPAILNKSVLQKTSNTSQVFVAVRVTFTQMSRLLLLSCVRSSFWDFVGLEPSDTRSPRRQKSNALEWYTTGSSQNLKKTLDWWPVIAFLSFLLLRSLLHFASFLSQTKIKSSKFCSFTRFVFYFFLVVLTFFFFFFLFLCRQQAQDSRFSHNPDRVYQGEEGSWESRKECWQLPVSGLCQFEKIS